MDRIGKYEILGELGQGGMGAVFKGRDTIIDRDVAIKVIHERALKDASIKKRFYREARSAGRLSHPNITIIHDVGEEDEQPFLVMEYLEGSDLRRIIDSDTPLSDVQKIAIATQICSGLHYAHENGVIHRDIKPENIRVLPDGTVKIMDFGIARIQSEAVTLTHTNMSIGTPRYMAPEQVKGEKIDHRADIFSFGVLLYELLSGTNPFSGENVTTIIYKILNTEPKPLEVEPDAFCKELQGIVTRCLAKDPKERYKSFSDVKRDLEDIGVPMNETVALPLSEHPTMKVPVVVSPVSSSLSKAPSRPSVPPPSSTSPAPERKRSRKGLWVMLGLMLVVSLAVGAYFVVQPDLSVLADMVARPTEDTTASPAVPVPTRPELASLTITPSNLSIGVDERAFLNVELKDTRGQVLGPEDRASYTLQWTSADTTVAVVEAISLTEGGTLGSVVTGRKRGGTTIAVVVGQTVQFVNVRVGVSGEVLAEAEEVFLTTQAQLQDASLPDSVVRANFEGIRDSLSYALTEDRLAEIEQTIERLSAAAGAFREAEARERSDTMTVVQQRANWQAYLDGAFRQNPTTQRAEQRLEEIDALIQRLATLEPNSLTTCDRAVPGGSTGALRICRDGDVTSQFAPGASVYFNARVDAPRSAALRWEWVGPDGAVVKQNRTRVEGVQGYRIWGVLSSADTQSPGVYQLRVYSGDDVLIGRRPFTIR